MIRPVTCLCFLLACGSGLYLYQASIGCRCSIEQIEQTVRSDRCAARADADAARGMDTAERSGAAAAAGRPVPHAEDRCAQSVHQPGRPGQPPAAPVPPARRHAGLRPRRGAEQIGCSAGTGRTGADAAACRHDVAGDRADGRASHAAAPDGIAARRAGAAQAVAPQRHRIAATSPRPATSTPIAIRADARGRRSSVARDRRRTPPSPPCRARAARLPSRCHAPPEHATWRCGSMPRRVARRPVMPCASADAATGGSSARHGARHGGAAGADAAAAADAGERTAMGRQRRRRLTMSDRHRSAAQPDPRRATLRPPAHRRGAARADAVPRMENVRVTAPDLQRRAALEKTRGRLVLAAVGFALLFLAVVGKLADATILQPLMPHRPERPIADSARARRSRRCTPACSASAPMITDRNGQILAISLPTVALFADPRQIIDPADAAQKLKQVLPRLDLDDGDRSACPRPTKQFVYLERQITPREEMAINELGIPGIDFQPDRGAALSDGPRRPRRCWAASTWTSMASPAWRSLSTSGCAPMPRRCACRSTCACRRWCARNCPRRWTSSRRSAPAAS